MISIPCPRCGGPLLLKRLHRGMLQCQYCAAFSAMRKLPEVTSNPELLEKIAQEARPVSVFADTLMSCLVITTSALAGWTLVFMALLVVRPSSPDMMLIIQPFIFVVIVSAMIFKRRLYSIGLALLNGMLLITKTVAGVQLGTQTWQSSGPFSFDGMILVLLGVVSLCSALPGWLQIRSARFRQDLGLLIPTPAAGIGMVIGASITVFTHGFPTTHQFLQRHEASLSPRVSTYTAFAAMVKSGAVKLPPTAPWPGSELLHFSPDDPCPTLDVMNLAELVHDLKSKSIGLYVKSPLAELVTRVVNRDIESYWGFDQRLESYLKRARCARIALMYHCTNTSSINLHDGGTWECRTWMLDLDSGKALSAATFTGSCYQRDCVEEGLALEVSIATGGKVQF